MLNLAFRIFLAALASAPLRAAWTTVGMGGGGAQYAPSISPLNSSLRFVGCDMSGWYRSLDGGSTWSMLDFYQISTRVDYGFSNGVMCAMAFHPTNPNIVYGWGPQQDSQNNPPALLVSSDAGLDWSVLAASPPWGAARVTQICLDRGDPSFMLIGTDSGVYRSVNAGAGFSATAGSSGYVCGLVVDESSPAGNRACYAGTDAGVFKSVNQGANWAAANTGLPTASVLSLAGASSASATRLFAVATGNNQVYTSTNAANWAMSSNADAYIMAACADNDTSTAYAIINSDRSVYKTSNGGTSWAKVFTDTNPVANAALGWIDYDLGFSGWASPNSMVSVNPADSNQVMFTNLGETQKSDDGGASWQEAYSNYADTPPRAQGQKWSSRGLEVTSAWHYDIDPYDSSYHYICYTDIGFAYSADHGQTWHDTARRVSPSVAWTNTFYQIAFDPVPGTLLAAASSLHDIDHSWPLGRAGTGGVLKSSDHGATWTSSSSGLPAAPATSIVRDASTGNYYVAMWGQGVYKSVNGGASWTACGAVAVGTNKDVYSLRLAGGKLYCLLAAQKNYTNAGGLFVSGDNGGTWANIAANAAGAGPLYYPTEFEINPANSSIIYIAAQDAKTTSGGCYQTLNGGTSWTPMVMPVGATPYGWGVCVDPGNTSTVYFGTENQGLFQSQDNGAHWSRFTGIPFSSIHRMFFAPSALYVTTFGGGVWMQSLASQPSPTPSPAAIFTATITKSATPAKSPTHTATPSPASSQTRTPGPGSTWTPSPSPAGSSTSSPSATLSHTAALPPTVSPDLTPTPSFTAAPAPESGGGLLEGRFLPNPGSGAELRFVFKVRGHVDSLDLSLYSTAFRRLFRTKLGQPGGYGDGWHEQILDWALPSGLYFGVARAGEEKVICRIYVVK